MHWIHLTVEAIGWCALVIAGVFGLLGLSMADAERSARRPLGGYTGEDHP